MAITDGRLDLGPWEQIFYRERGRGGVTPPLPRQLLSETASTGQRLVDGDLHLRFGHRVGLIGPTGPDLQAAPLHRATADGQADWDADESYEKEC